MAYEIITTKRFEKEVKRCIKRGYDMSKLKSAINILAKEGHLPPKYKPHILHGNRDNQWECHLESDWLLIWEQNDQELTMLMLNTGTHSDVF